MLKTVTFACIFIAFISAKSDKQFGAIKVNESIMLGGLFPVHAWEQDRWTSANECGGLLKEKGMQRLEAMLYEVDRINANPARLNGLRLGVHILDTCSKDTHAFRVGFDFIRLAMSGSNQAHDLYKCPGGVQPTYIAPKPVAAVIGAASSVVSVQVANLLGQFKIPQISYSSTGTRLSDRVRYEYFSRVVPPDNLQANAMVDVCKKFNWNLVHAVADRGDYGELGIDNFKSIAQQNGIFIDNKIIIEALWTSHDFDNMIKQMKGGMNRGETPMQSQIARGVIMFVNEHNVNKILKSLRRLTESDSSYEGHFMFVASDSWGQKTSPVLGVEEQAIGAITVAPKQLVDAGFDEYFLALHPGSHKARNVWFAEFWHDLGCTSKHKNLEDCFKSVDYIYKQESYVSYVIKAVQTLAEAINRYLQEDCKGTYSSSNSHKCSVSFEGKRLQEYYRNISFEEGEPPVIDENGDGIGEYIIYQYTYNLSYVPVGQWRDDRLYELLHFNLDAVKAGLAFNSTDDIPSSLCSRECGIGEKKNIQDMQRWLCWTCLPCYSDDDVNNKHVLETEFKCERCINHTVPNAAKNDCVPLVAETIEWSSPWAIAPAFFSVMGILATAVVVYTFIRFNRTPVIMASGRELCYFMIVGIACTYMMTFVLVAPPSVVTCAMVRVGLGLSLTCIYAAILTKTSRLARVFKTQIKSTKPPKFISPMSQVVICGSLVSIQLVGAIAWLIWDNPATVTIYNDLDNHAVLSCSATASAMMLSLLYNVSLVIACTFFAFKTRKIPENFNETKYIGFTMYATCIIWLAFVPIYFATMDQFRIQVTSFSVCISLSGTVALGCFFAPKVYICLFQPEKNVRNKGAVKALFSQQMAVLRTMNDARHFTQSSMPGFMSAGGQLAQMAVHVHRDEEDMDESYRQTTDDKATNDNPISNNITAGSINAAAARGQQSTQPMSQQVNTTKPQTTTPVLSTISASGTGSDENKHRNDFIIEHQPGELLESLPNTSLITQQNEEKPVLSPIIDDLCGEEDEVLSELTPFLHSTEPLTNGNKTQNNHHHHSNTAFIDPAIDADNFEVRMRKSQSMPSDVIVQQKGKTNNSISFTTTSATGNSNVAMEKILSHFAAKQETFL